MALISDARLYNGEYYRYARGEYEYDETFADSANAVCSADDDDSNCTSPRAPLDMPLSRKNWIDFEVTDEKSLPKVLFLFCAIASSLLLPCHDTDSRRPPPPPIFLFYHCLSSTVPIVTPRSHSSYPPLSCTYNHDGLTKFG